jgi:thiol-disulfide isomerase/thioredoxin
MATPLSVIFLNFWNPKKLTFWILFLVLLLICGAVYVITKNKYRIQNNKEITNIPNAQGTGGDVNIMFFTVDWCPHCKNAKNPWEDFKIAYHGKKVKGRNIRCDTYNVTDDKVNGKPNPAIEFRNKYKVDSYPTIKMLKDGQVIDFDAKVTTYALERFVEDMI